LEHFRVFILTFSGWNSASVLPGISLFAIILSPLYVERPSHDFCAHSPPFQGESASTPTTLFLSHAPELSITQCFEDWLTFRRPFPFRFRRI
jgi:hypothetical protein